MEETEEEVEMTMESRSRSSWSAQEGSLEQSVKVVEDSEDAIYTAGPTSKLVLVAPSSPEPCELTVTFQQRLGHVHQIYVLSTARICEIYGQKEEDGDQEYVCTVRGGIISLAEDDLPDNASELSRQEEPDLTNADNVANSTSSSPPVIAELDSATEFEPTFLSKVYFEESGAMGKAEHLQPRDVSPSLTRKGSEEELFRSFTEASSGRIVDGSIVFEESLDQADWVECPHSPMKSSSSSSDDETEVDVTKSGFYFIDADNETRRTYNPRVSSFSDEIGNSGKKSSSLPLEGSDIESSTHSSWQEATEEEPTLEKSMTDVVLPQGSTAEQHFKEAQKAEDPCDSPGTRLDQVEDDNLPRTGFCVFEVNGEHDSRNLAITNPTADNVIAETHEVGSEVAERSLLDSVDGNGEVVSKTSSEPTVYECEVSLVNADAWTSVTIRLLSMKSKSQVEIHRVVVTYMPGPPTPPPSTSPPGGPFQQGAGASSLLAMLVPGILQMARGMSERKAAMNVAISSDDEGPGESGVVISQVRTDKLGLLSEKSPAPGKVAPDSAKMCTEHHASPHVVDKNPNCGVEEKASYHSEHAEGDSFGTSSLESVADGGTGVSTGHGEQGLHNWVLPRVLEDKGTRKFEQIEKNRGLSEAQQKQDDGVGVLVQRLDRLETICLRMESSLNSALESMDKRLTLLESGGLARMPPSLGHPIWGPGFDSGSFVSATSVHQLSAGIASVKDSQVPFSIPSVGDVQAGEASAKCISSTETPFYADLLPSTSPSLISSLSSALPSWPRSSWAQNVSPASSTHSSGLTASFISKSGLMNQSTGSLQDSEHLSNGGETYWESRSSDDSETDISSDSERTSYADNCEDPGCESCPESLSSSPAKPAQLVDNALASALSAFSASFGAQNSAPSKQEEVYPGGEDTDEEDSFTSEEQVPLVELDYFSSYLDKAEVTDGNAEKVFMHDYEAIPLSGDKDMGDLNIRQVIQEDEFWPSENEGNQQINWQDEGLEEKIFRAMEEFINQTDGVTTTFEASSGVVVHPSDELCVDDSTTQAILPAGLDRDLQKSAVQETTKDDNIKAGLEALREDLQQNPFLQELASGVDGNAPGAQAPWLEQGWSGQHVEIAQNVMSSYLSVRGFSKPLDSHEEMLLQEGLFPDEWNWFTSEFSPFSSLVEVRDLSEEVPAEKEPLPPLMETTFIEESSAKIAPGPLEPWSLLDEDASTPKTTQDFHWDMNAKDGQKSQWSLLDDDPPDLISGDHRAEEGSPGEGLGRREPRSLLDEDISVPSGEFPGVKQEINLYATPPSLEDYLTLPGAMRSSKYKDELHSPSSQASRSNPFEDEYIEGLDFSQESNDVPLVLLEEFGEDGQDFGVTEPEKSQSLLFHLSQ